MTNEVTVTMQHLRQLKYCASGVRGFFQEYNLDYADFLHNGIEGSKLLQACNHNDLAVKAVEIADEQ